MCCQWLLDMVNGRFKPPSSVASSARSLDNGSEEVTVGDGPSSVSSAQRDGVGESDTLVAVALPQVFALRLKEDEAASSLTSNTLDGVAEETTKADVPAVSGFESRNWADTLPDSEHVQFFKSVDWGKTELGPLKDWGTALKIHTFTVMADSRPCTLYW